MCFGGLSIHVFVYFHTLPSLLKMPLLTQCLSAMPVPGSWGFWEKALRGVPHGALSHPLRVHHDSKFRDLVRGQLTWLYPDAVFDYEHSRVLQKRNG